MTPAREFTAVLAASVAAAVVLLLSASQVWVTHTFRLAAGPIQHVRGSGAELAHVQAAGLAALTATLAVLATRRAGRIVVGVLLAADGLLALWLVVRFLIDIRDGLPIGGPDGVVAVSGQPGTSLSLWPWIGMFGGLSTTAIGTVVVLRGHRWPGLSTRYERASRPAGGTEQPMWDVLDRGDDPTR